MRPLRVFLDVLPWDMRKRNTDWRYGRFTLPRLSEFESKLTLIAQRSPAVTARGNAEVIAAAVKRRVGLRVSPRSLWTHRLSRRDLRRARADVVLAQTFPCNADTVPLVWVNAVVDPAMQLGSRFGVSAAALRDEIEMKRPLFHRAARVLTYSEVEAERHRTSFPESADRFVAAPFFLPHVRACAEAELERHRDAAPVRVLFVGNHAVRKGLPELLEAFQRLPAPVLARAELTIVSNFDRSPMDVPRHDRVRVVRGAGSDAVLREMRRSHILVNVAHFESYGIVFLEAMAQGMVCLGPSWEVQRELFAGGTAGMNLRCDAVAIRMALEQLIEGEALRCSMARAAWLRFQQMYAPAIAAARYCRIFEDACGAQA